jgi:homoserine kinase type II
MAVFTEVSDKDARELLRRMSLGSFKELRGIQGGIENTNYFLTTDQGEWVLTLFERLSAEQLPLPLPDEASGTSRDSRAGPAGRDTQRRHSAQGLRQARIHRQPPGRQEPAAAVHCAAVGEMLARMHLAGQDYNRQQPNLRGLPWWNETVPVVLPHLGEETAAMLRAELAYQNHIAASASYAALPRGPIHADLFRDNVMFDGDRLTGFFDFYFAGVDTWLFDLAVCLNDWCIDHATGAHDAERAKAMLAAYQAVRPLTGPERELLNAQLRAGALRFWISRLWDFHLPREAALLQPHDPTHFERVLSQRIAHPLTLD